VSLKIFGVNEVAVRLPSILLSSLGIFLTYFIGKEFFKEKVGLLAAFFYAINGFLIDLASGRSATDHPEILFVFFVELRIFLSVYYLKHRSFFVITLVGIATGYAVLTKWLPRLIIVGILYLLLIQQESWKLAIGKCAVVMWIARIFVVPWQVYIYSTFPREAAWESYFNYLHIFEPLEEHDGTVFYHIALMPKFFGELIYIPIIMFFFTFFNKQFSTATVVLAF
jgi:4-amino-4-deoxy-L-arabinose transferase-like glycosyltransferase